MRLLGRLLLVIMFAWLVMAAGPYELPNWRNTDSGDWDNDFSAYPVFWLDSQQALNFEIPANAAQVRIQLTPVVEGDNDNQIDETLSYQVVYRTLDSGQRVLNQTRRTFVVDAKASNINRAARFFDQPDGEQAGLSEGLFIEGRESLAELQIQLNPIPLNSNQRQNNQPSNARVAVRVSVLERKKDADLPVLWQRMHRDGRAAVMAGNIYPAEMVSDSERRNALKFSWLPVGPTGVKGQAYQTATLFIGDTIVADDNNGADDPQLSIAKEAEPMAAELNAIRGYISQPQQPLHYALALNSDAVQPIRLDVRGLQSVGLDNRSQAVNWRVLDHQGTRLLSGTLATLTENDAYESLPLNVDDAPYSQIYAKNSGYIVAPAEATTLVVEASSAAVLISVFTRPLSLSYVVDELQPLPKWFMALPIDYQAHKANGYSQVFYWQQRLQDEQLASAAELASSQWSALATVENLPSYQLFSEVANELPDVAPVVNLNHYRPMPSTGWSGLFGDEKRGSDRAEKGVSPSLVYIRRSASDEPLKVLIKVDDQPATAYWLAAASGRFSLPEMAAGQHTINIDGPSGVKWYINQTLSGESEQGYRIRSAYSLASPLTFAVEKKAAQEWVSFHYFPTTKAAHQLDVKLMVQQPSGEFAAHTVPARRYAVLAQDSGQSVQLLNQPGKAIGAAQVFHFPLDQDLINRHYQLRVTSAVNSGFIQASYVFTDDISPMQLFEHLQQTY